MTIVFTLVSACLAVCMVLAANAYRPGIHPTWRALYIPVVGMLSLYMALNGAVALILGGEP